MCAYILQSLKVNFLHCLDEHSSEAEHGIKVGIQQAELCKLIRLLTDCVLHHDFDQAGEIMDALCLRANEAGEVSIKVSLLIKSLFFFMISLHKIHYIFAPPPSGGLL